MSKPQLVLLTGATGHIGFTTLLHALTTGHTVRCAVRSHSKAATILAHPHIQALSPGDRLSFVIVEDITTPHAYDEALEGVTHVIHVASPLVTGDTVPLAQHREYFIRPAQRGTLGMLESAKRSGSVKRVVITSSITALVKVSEMEGAEKKNRKVTGDDRVEFEGEPYESEFAAYAASKVAALQAAENFMKTESPSFDIIHLHPSFVLGRNHLAATHTDAMRGTNAVILALLLGKRFDAFAGATVHVDDVARCHVRALSLPPSSPFPTNRSYILSGQSTWEDSKAIAARRFPDAFDRRVLTTKGTCGSVDLEFDVGRTEEVFGKEWKSFEDQVVSVVGQFLELREMARERARRNSKAAGMGKVEQGVREVRAHA